MKKYGQVCRSRPRGSLRYVNKVFRNEKNCGAFSHDECPASGCVKYTRLGKQGCRARPHKNKNVDFIKRSLVEEESPEAENTTPTWNAEAIARETMEKVRKLLPSFGLPKPVAEKNIEPLRKNISKYATRPLPPVPIQKNETGILAKESTLREAISKKKAANNAATIMNAKRKAFSALREVSKARRVTRDERQESKRKANLFRIQSIKKKTMAALSNIVASKKAAEAKADDFYYTSLQKKAMRSIQEATQAEKDAREALQRAKQQEEEAKKKFTSVMDALKEKVKRIEAEYNSANDLKKANNFYRATAKKKAMAALKQAIEEEKKAKELHQLRMQEIENTNKAIEFNLQQIKKRGMRALQEAMAARKEAANMEERAYEHRDRTIQKSALATLRQRTRNSIAERKRQTNANMARNNALTGMAEMFKEVSPVAKPVAKPQPLFEIPELSDEESPVRVVAPKMQQVVPQEAPAGVSIVVRQKLNKLREFIVNGNVAMVKSYLSMVDVNSRLYDDKGAMLKDTVLTASIKAVKGSKRRVDNEMIVKLVSERADPNIANGDGEYAIEIATRNDNKDIVSQLLKKKSITLSQAVASKQVSRRITMTNIDENSD
jgi:hypothetical protein